MSDWKIQYLQRPVTGGVAVHGIIQFVDPTGKVLLALEGLPSGKAITPDENIIVHSYDPGKGQSLPHHDPTLGVQDLFKGSEQEIRDRMRAALDAQKLINDQNTGYPLLGFGETNRTRGISNSNAVISTLVRVMRVDEEPAPRDFPPGHREVLLNRDQINAIREKYRIAPTLDQLKNSFDIDNQPLRSDRPIPPPKPNRRGALEPSDTDAGLLRPASLQSSDNTPETSSTALRQPDARTDRRAEIEAEMRKPKIDNRYWRDPAMQEEYRTLLEPDNTRPPLAPRPDDAARKAEIEEEMRKGRQGEYFRAGSFLPDEYFAILKREAGATDSDSFA